MRNSVRSGWVVAAVAAVLAGAAVARGDTMFTIAVIPDTQNYTDNMASQPAAVNVLNGQMNYLVNNQAGMNLAFTTFLGDIVQNGDGTDGTNPIYGGPAEYNRAADSIGILAASGMPFGMTIGNHDYDNEAHSTGNSPLAGTTMWRNYFGSTSPFFAGKSWYGGASDNLAVNPGASSYRMFTAGGKTFMNISLELEAGDSALAWAQSVINAHPGVPTFVTTHAYLNPPGNRDSTLPLVTPAQRIPASLLVNSPGGWNGAQDVWNKFISTNDQIFMVLCGHAWGTPVNGVSKAENIRIDDNDFGHPVYQILTDYQANTVGPDGGIDSAPGGAGWMRFMQFDMTTDTIHFSTYSSLLDKYAGLNGEYTFNQAPSFSDFCLPIPPQAVPEPSSLLMLALGGMLIGLRKAARSRRVR